MISKYIHVTEDEPPHKGWRIYSFRWCDRGWRMTTIDNKEETLSLIAPDDRDDRHSWWPSYYKHSANCILTVDAACEIILFASNTWAKGFMQGEAHRVSEIKKALGI